MDKLARLENEFVEQLGRFFRARQAHRRRNTQHTQIAVLKSERAADEAWRRFLLADEHSQPRERA